MPATELFHDSGSPAAVWYCSECKIVHPDKDQAEWCHGQRPCACGKPSRGRFYSTCDECDRKAWKAKEAATELAKFEKAAKVEYKDYKGEKLYCNDQYFDSLDEYLDSIEDFDTGEAIKPEYVWAVKNIGIGQADIDNVLEPILSDAWEDADISDLNGVEELQTAIDVFNEANKSVVMWMVDYSTAVLIPADFVRSPIGETAEAA